MKKSNRCFPVGDLPYLNDKAAVKMMIKLFEDMPYLASLPLLSSGETIVSRTLSRVPGIIIKDKKVFFDKESEALKKKFLKMDIMYNNPTIEGLNEYSFESTFLEKYFQIVERIKPSETVFNLFGPFSTFQLFRDQEPSALLTDKYYRKIIIQAISLKALWVVTKIKELSPNTVPIVVLEEPNLHKVGLLKRENEEITVDMIVNLFSKVISKLHEHGAKVAIQCFEKCDWKIPINAGVDIISFDAYNNPNNLNIMAEEVNEFLAHGGKINWAIVPTMNETIVRSMSADMIYDRLLKTFEGLIVAGVSEKLVYNRSMVSMQGNVSGLPLLFAEKALMTTSQVAKRIPIKA